MKVVVISPRILVRQALCSLLGEVKLIDELMAFDSIRGLAAADGKSQPLVVLIHANELCAGIDSLRQLYQLLPEARAILLSDDQSEESCMQALEAGAWGRVSTAEHLHVLLEALFKVAGGERWYGHLVANAVFERIISVQERPARLGKSLTPRESEVLRLLARGRSGREFPSCLPIGKETDHSHMRSIYRRLTVNAQPVSPLSYSPIIQSHNTLSKHSEKMSD